MSDRVFSLSQTGHVRSNNQDTVLVEESLGLFVVADGMGGHAGGAQASRIACEAVQEAIENGMPLEDAFEVAHSWVRVAQSEDDDYKDMGTTLVSVLENGSAYDLAWVGDSRIYRYRPGRNGLELLTRDHNVVGRLLETGEITPSQARVHPHRHVLTDCIGQREGNPNTETAKHEWKKGDCLLLCSDGLTGEVSDEKIEELMASGDPLEEIGETLAEHAMDNGGRDNISIILLKAPE